jgi:two-component system NtrC family sensor kinase
VTDSETQYFFVRASCFNEGEDGRTIVVLENITEVKRAEEALRQQQEALYESEKLAAMGALLASVAHELNNPLAAMQMQLDLLAEEMPEHIQQERLSEAREATGRCIRIVQSFLTLARRRTPQRLPVEINAVVENAVQFLSHALQLDNVTVEQQLADNLPLIGADAVELQQVLVNLLLNAQQAIQGSTAPLALRQVKLTTQLDTAQNRLILEVADTGPGIPAHLQEHIFEPFVTSKPVGVGTGLGLSVCRGIIEGHGGTIRVVERCGYGAVFRIELPVEPAAITESVATEGPLTPAPVGAVLIVDDEVGLARALARLLGRDGHTVDIATNGYQALTMLQTQEYDLILCDLRMPELDGPGLYRAVGARYPHLQSRFIFLTGDTLGKEARDFLEHAGVPHLVKPFSASEGRRLVQQALTASA